MRGFFMYQTLKIMNNRITPYNITELKENEIFVFGSNPHGVHKGNAASMARQFGAIMGQPVGIQGRTYAMPSKNLDDFKKYIADFLIYAEQYPGQTFLVTEIGCGISKHTPLEIAPLFKEAVRLENIHLPFVFWDVLNCGIKERIRLIAGHEATFVPEFWERTGIAPAAIMNILFGNEYPSIWDIQKILIAFPDINPRWLLLGEGNMESPKSNRFITKINRFLHTLFSSK